MATKTAQSNPREFLSDHRWTMKRPLPYRGRDRMEQDSASPKQAVRAGPFKPFCRSRQQLTEFAKACQFNHMAQFEAVQLRHMLPEIDTPSATRSATKNSSGPGCCATPICLVSLVAAGENLDGLAQTWLFDKLRPPSECGGEFNGSTQQ